MIALGFARGISIRKQGYDDPLALIRELVAHRPDVWVAEWRRGEALVWPPGSRSMPQTSASLLERLSDRSDSEAWTRLVEIYSPLIRGWLGRYELAESDADDLSRTVLTCGGGQPSQLRAQRPNRRVPELASNDHRQQRPPEVPHGPKDGGHAGRSASLASLNELDDPDGGLSQVWDRTHDAHVLRTLLTWAEPEFESQDLAGVSPPGA